MNGILKNWLVCMMLCSLVPTITIEATASHNNNYLGKLGGVFVVTSAILTACLYRSYKENKNLTRCLREQNGGKEEKEEYHNALGLDEVGTGAIELLGRSIGSGFAYGHVSEDKAHKRRIHNLNEEKIWHLSTISDLKGQIMRLKNGSEAEKYEKWYLGALAWGEVEHCRRRMLEYSLHSLGFSFSDSSYGLPPSIIKTVEELSGTYEQRIKNSYYSVLGEVEETDNTFYDKWTIYNEECLKKAGLYIDNFDSSASKKVEVGVPNGTTDSNQRSYWENWVDFGAPPPLPWP